MATLEQKEEFTAYAKANNIDPSKLTSADEQEYLATGSINLNWKTFADTEKKDIPLNEMTDPNNKEIDPKGIKSKATPYKGIDWKEYQTIRYNNWMLVTIDTSTWKPVTQEYTDEERDSIKNQFTQSPTTEDRWRKVVSESEQKRILENERRINEPFYDRKRSELSEDYQSNVSDLDRLIQYSQSDLAKNLQKDNTTFARAMSNATKAYWRRNLIWSWVQKTHANEKVEDLDKQISNREEYQARQEEWYENRQQNLATQYARGQTNIKESEDYTAYSQAIKTIQQNQADLNRGYWEDQKNIESYVTKPTTPTAKPYSEDYINKFNTK